MSEQAVGKSMGPREAVTEAIKAVAPGLSLGKILGDMGAEMHRMGVQGSAELASILFSPGNTAYVPYGRGQNPTDKGLEGEEPKQEENNRSGREM
jgi:hypothetical protein